MTELVELEAVRKSYASKGGRRNALDSLDLVVPEGGVFGLLGPNGSGKTTTLRLIFGLVRADAGRVHVLGRSVPRDLPVVLPMMGCLIEGPAFFPSFSGRRNLEILARVGGLRSRAVTQALRSVDLVERQHDPVKHYSLGMRQRLGIAAALLRRPRLLVLDEPGNGLDPAGVVQIRDFIRGVAASGDTTVVLSSHVLAEMEQVCDRVAVLRQGRTVAAGTVDSIIRDGRLGAGVRVVLDDPYAAMSVLEGAGYSVNRQGEALVVETDDTRAVSALLGRAGLDIVEINRTRASLEDAFLHLTAEDVT